MPDQDEQLIELAASEDYCGCSIGHMQSRAWAREIVRLREALFAIANRRCERWPKPACGECAPCEAEAAVSHADAPPETPEGRA